MTLNQAKRQWVKRQRRYAVGYVASGNTMYFSRYQLRGPIGDAPVDPMTLTEASMKLAMMPCSGAAVFELMPVAVPVAKTRRKK